MCVCGRVRIDLVSMRELFCEFRFMEVLRSCDGMYSLALACTMCVWKSSYRFSIHEGAILRGQFCEFRFMKVLRWNVYSLALACTMCVCGRVHVNTSQVCIHEGAIARCLFYEF